MAFFLHEPNLSVCPKEDVQRTVFAFPSKRPKAFPAWTRAVSFEWYDIFLNEATFYVTVAP
ncbi:hypothetical protein ALQ88_200033 [Pseudomonas savastanoi]|nr:hypothetical protein ALQ88_200033 [Pseudomonas savastanoi]